MLFQKYLMAYSDYKVSSNVSDDSIGALYELFDEDPNTVPNTDPNTVPNTDPNTSDTKGTDDDSGNPALIHRLPVLTTPAIIDIDKDKSEKLLMNLLSKFDYEDNRGDKYTFQFTLVNDNKSDRDWILRNNHFNFKKESKYLTACKEFVDLICVQVLNFFGNKTIEYFYAYNLKYYYNFYYSKYLIGFLPKVPRHPISESEYNCGLKQGTQPSEALNQFISVYKTSKKDGNTLDLTFRYLQAIYMLDLTANWKIQINNLINGQCKDLLKLLNESGGSPSVLNWPDPIYNPVPGAAVTERVAERVAEPVALHA